MSTSKASARFSRAMKKVTDAGGARVAAYLSKDAMAALSRLSQYEGSKSAAINKALIEHDKRVP